MRRCFIHWGTFRLSPFSLLPHASFTRREKPSCQVVGNLRFPLTLTYHGCPSSASLQSCAKSGLRLSMSPMRGDVKEKSSPFLSEGNGCCGLHPAHLRSGEAVGSRVFRTDQAVGGFYSMVS